MNVNQVFDLHPEDLAWENVTGRKFAPCEKYYPMANRLSMWAEISADITSQRVCPPVRLLIM